MIRRPSRRRVKVATIMERGKKRVVIVANTCWNLVNYRWNLIRRLSIAGYEVHVLAPQDNTFQSCEHEINYHEFNLSAYESTPSRDKVFSFTFYSNEKSRADLVLTFTIKPNIHWNCNKVAEVPFIPNVTGRGLHS